MQNEFRLNALVLHGKHKGKPIAKLIQDVSYVNWMERHAGEGPMGKLFDELARHKLVTRKGANSERCIPYPRAQRRAQPSSLLSLGMEDSSASVIRQSYTSRSNAMKRKSPAKNFVSPSILASLEKKRQVRSTNPSTNQTTGQNIPPALHFGAAIGAKFIKPCQRVQPLRYKLHVDTPKVPIPIVTSKVSKVIKTRAKPLEKKSTENTFESSCVVCLEPLQGSQRMAFVPCGHSCFCLACYEKPISRKQVDNTETCFVCRDDVVSIIKVYL